MSHDVCVIGLGRVGLPLALCFADAGLRVLGVDHDTERLQALRAGRMPFKEPGTDELLARVDLDLSPRASDAADADAIVLTLGTPSFSHIEIDMGAIRAVLDDLLGVLRPGHLLVLRSTLRSCRRRPCRPSWRRSGRTSCATRRSRCPTC